jgi:hypothetical protein
MVVQNGRRGRLRRSGAGAGAGTPPLAPGAASGPDGAAPHPGVRRAAAWDDPARVVLLEALRRLDDPVNLQRLTPLTPLTPLTRLRVVQERAGRQYRDGWCAAGRALRDVLQAAVEPVAEVLPPQSAAMLRELAAGGTAADAARRCGVNPAALRKRATPQIEEALLRYLEHLETLAA